MSNAVRVETWVSEDGMREAYRVMRGDAKILGGFCDAECPEDNTFSRNLPGGWEVANALRVLGVQVETVRELTDEEYHG